jgi:hypothetical protein
MSGEFSSQQASDSQLAEDYADSAKGALLVRAPGRGRRGKRQALLAQGGWLLLLLLLLLLMMMMMMGCCC